MRTLIAATATALAALALNAPAAAQTGSGQFCLKSTAGSAKCAYQTMAQCEQAKSPGSTDQCVERSQVEGTTGSGAGTGPGGSASPGGSPMPSPGSPQR